MKRFYFPHLDCTVTVHLFDCIVTTDAVFPLWEGTARHTESTPEEARRYFDNYDRRRAEQFQDWCVRLIVTGRGQVKAWRIPDNET